MRISGNARIDWVLSCLRATYGFGIFQLALLCDLISSCRGMVSVWDENYISWIRDGRHVISLTADVDDLPITGCKWCRYVLHRLLKARFGALELTLFDSRRPHDLLPNAKGTTLCRSKRLFLHMVCTGTRHGGLSDHHVTAELQDRQWCLCSYR